MCNFKDDERSWSDTVCIKRRDNNLKTKLRALNVVYFHFTNLLGQGVLAGVLLLLRDVAHQLEGERSSARVPLHGPDAPAGGAGQRQAALCFLRGSHRTQLKLFLFNVVTRGLPGCPHCTFVSLSLGWFQ